MDLTKIENAYDASLKTGEGRTVTGEEPGFPKDRVCLSEQSKKQGEFPDAVATATEQVQQGTSPEKLRQLKAAIADGTYRVDGEAIADAILGRR
ncbi:MAG TPA: flagellar biosynthesis anti-sigma factor FlgM [Candidatus Acidoferrum sp.]|nr:flagellar biosynthesis anti-sigma factor FlgM [Candidatus Acidoferrum sp.]